jgi:4-hydroxy-3-methylbut-2-enyl diphosphate reductase
MTELSVLAPLRSESFAFGGADVIVGAGRARAQYSSAKFAARTDERSPIALVGAAGALAPDLVPGDLVLATEIRSVESSTARHLPSTPLLTGEFRRAGIRVHTGPIITATRYVTSGERANLAVTGALAVDMESSWVMDHFPNNPLAVVRAISDSAGRGPIRGGLRALRALSTIRGPLDRWARACGEHEVIMASPRSFCAGVDRAIETVERAIELYGSPIYVRRQIVHNIHVVRDLESKGALFVEEIAEVPEGAIVVFVAHGVSPEVRGQTSERKDLTVIDATCPLVAKVHTEARRFASQDYDILLIGHGDHEEMIGTLGEAPERIRVVADANEVNELEFVSDRPVAYLTQTTLATDETTTTIAALRRRFSKIAAPPADDICFATQNRQDAVRSIARKCDLLLVVGSANSSNTARLVEVTQREGCRAELIEDISQLELGWLEGVRTIGLTAGASVPERLVQEVTMGLASLGPIRLSEERVPQETIRFALASKVR